MIKSVFDWMLRLVFWPFVTPFLWLKHRNTTGVAFERFGNNREHAYFYIGKCGTQTKGMQAAVKQLFNDNKIDPKTKERIWGKWYGAYWVEDKNWAWSIRETMNNEIGIPISSTAKLLGSISIVEVGG